MADQAELARWIAAMAGGVAAVAVAGAVADVALRRSTGVTCRALPRVWALSLLVVSYGFLVPGLILDLFEADVSVTFFGITEPITAVTENMLELVRRLAFYDLYAGVIFVVTYAMVIPALKVCLLLATLVLRSSGTQGRCKRLCVLVVRWVSKWACPDMFAYILMQSLFRSLNKPPSLHSDMRLGLGFTCFCVFCLGSTVSSLGLRVPQVGPDSAEAREMMPSAQASASLERRSRSSGTPARRQGRRREGAIAAALVLGLGFAALLGLGLSLPCMTLRMDMDLLYEHNPKMAAMAFILDDLNLPALLHSEVSVCHCIAGLAEWVLEGDANSAIALVMYVVFAIALAILDVVALFVATVCGSLRRPALRVSHVLRKLAMLDVSIAGTIVIVFAMLCLRQNGIIIALGPGIAPLICAEVCHYAMALVAEPPHWASLWAAAAPAAEKLGGKEAGDLAAMEAGDGVEATGFEAPSVDSTASTSSDGSVLTNTADSEEPLR